MVHKTPAGEKFPLSKSHTKWAGWSTAETTGFPVFATRRAGMIIRR
jgi:hypothetical protein